MEHILSIIIFFPALGAILAFFVEEKSLRAYGIFIAFIELILTLILWYKTTISTTANVSEFIALVPEFGISYYLKVDGISLFLVILSAFMSLVALISVSIKEKFRHLIVCVLFLEMAMVGVFVSFDAVIFYIFWEISLIPMLYIIGIWGSGEKIYASVKFFIYTFFGSMFLLVGIVAMGYLCYKANGVYSFNFDDWNALNVPFNAQICLFFAFGIAFAVKTPVFPFHTWLPYAHGQAPTIGSVLLAAILLKMGTYAFVRFSLPFFPDASAYLAGFMAILGVIMVIYASFVAFGQKDIKQVIAYSSIAHMGVVILGIFSLNVEGINGAIFMMISHGLVSGMLFMLIGFLYDRTHTKLLSEFGGIAKVIPVFALIFGIAIFANMGLPLTVGFVGEFLSLAGVFKLSPFFAIFGGFGVIMGAIYSLNIYKKTFFGSLANKNANLKDLNKKELISVVPIAILILVLGIFPNLILNNINYEVKNQMAQIYLKSNSATKKALNDATFIKE